MREIKFRVLNCGVIIAYEYLNTLGWFHVLLNNNTHYSGCFPDAEFGHKERCDRDQYTGLKDKNGVEIYEGDIVKKHVEFWSDPADIGGKRWVCIDYLYEIKWGKWSWVKLPQGSVNPVSFDSIECKEVEIIGNIYEHPHLLTQTK